MTAQMSHVNTIDKMENGGSFVMLGFFLDQFRWLEINLFLGHDAKVDLYKHPYICRYNQLPFNQYRELSVKNSSAHEAKTLLLGASRGDQDEIETKN